MNNKTILKIAFIIVVCFILLSTNVYATDNTNISIKTELTKSKTEDNSLEVKLSITMNNMPEGTNAYTGKIKYNTEQLKLIEVKGLNDWNTPTYKDNSGEVKKAGTKSIFKKYNSEV